MACVAAGLALALSAAGQLAGNGSRRLDAAAHLVVDCDDDLGVRKRDLRPGGMAGLARGATQTSEQEAELKLLQAQIRPHYLFNTLANVRSLIDFARGRPGRDAGCVY
ncbi:MAG: histidine kinase [Rhodoferax sp.]|nr:histidine kinase [Rhodoferax sp.]